MSTSLLFHAFKIKGYNYIKTEYLNGKVIIHIKEKKKFLKCPICGCKNIIRHGEIERIFKHLPIGSKDVRLRYNVPRVECKKCEKTRQIKILFADECKTYTKPFERYVLSLLEKMTIQDVAISLKLSWDTVKEIQKKHLFLHYGKPSLKDVKRIAIDETSIRKGYKYITVVLNPATGEVLFVGDGKGADALKPFWKRVKRSKIKIEAVAIDMSSAYISAVKKT